MGRGSSASRRAAGTALALIVATALVRLLTLPLPPAQWGAELAIGLVGGIAAGIVIPLMRRDWMQTDLAVVLRQAAGAVLAGAMVALAAGYLDRLDVLAVLLFAAVHLGAPGGARARAHFAGAVLINGALAATWLVWQKGDVPTLLVALALLTALRLAIIAQARAAGATARSDKLRSSAHAATAERVGTAIDVLGVTRAVLDDQPRVVPDGHPCRGAPLRRGARPAPTAAAVPGPARRRIAWTTTTSTSRWHLARDLLGGSSPPAGRWSGRPRTTCTWRSPTLARPSASRSPHSAAAYPCAPSGLR